MSEMTTRELFGPTLHLPWYHEAAEEVFGSLDTLIRLRDEYEKPEVVKLSIANAIARAHQKARTGV